jgi:hypothetical protein
MKSYNELIEAILIILPNAKFSEDDNGQITILTGVAEEDGEVLEIETNLQKT